MINKNEVTLAKSFEFEGTKIQIHWEGEDPWFAANELCAVFGYGYPRQAVKRHVKGKDVTKRDTLTTKGRQSMTYKEGVAFHYTFPAK